MAKTKLFEAWSFRLQQPAPFDDPKYAGSKSMGFSQYNTSSTAQKSTLHAPTMRALLAYAKLVSATENGQSVDGLGAIGHQGTTYRISEYRSANKTDCVVFNPVTGKFNAAQVEDGTQALKPYSVGAGNGTGSGLLFCLMPVLNEDDEFRQKFQEFVSLLESGWADMDAAFDCALTLCDNVYRRIENSKQLGSDGVKISIPTTGNISVITQMAMDSGNYAPTGASYGEFTIMQMSGTPTAKRVFLPEGGFCSQVRALQPYSYGTRAGNGAHAARLVHHPRKRSSVSVSTPKSLRHPASQCVTSCSGARLVPARPWAHRQSQQGSICPTRL